MSLVALAWTMPAMSLEVEVADSSAPSAAQPKHEGWSLKWTGFVNPHYYADSRSVVGGREDMMLFYPKPVELDANGKDVNAGWQANMLAITARLGLRVTGPDMLGARTSAYIEGDFTGATNASINNLRLRHAYIDLDWGRHRLLMGQYWYGMVVHEIMPMTNPLNMGAPFHPYARYNQVRYAYRLGHWEAVGVAQWQLDNASQGWLDGAYTSSTLFARHSLVPEVNAQLRYHVGRWMVGVAANVKTLRPVVQTVGSIAADAVPMTDVGLHSSYTWSVYGRYVGREMTVKAQSLLHNNLYEGCSLGGYMLVGNLVDGSQKVEDWSFDTYWIDIERNRGRWRPGIFVGYAHHVSKPEREDVWHTEHVFGRGYEMEYLWRVQPRLTYALPQGLSFTAEAEYTRAGYEEPVGNLRLSLSAVYAF